MDFLINALTHDGHFILRLLVAMLLGGLVGLERQTRGRAAGLRTNILVCLGSAAIIVAFQKLSQEMGAGADSAIRMDPARAAAGVITGIGFLGAGTIVKSKNFVRGLTTAASIWVVSAIGVTVGLGEFVIAGVVTLLVLLALYALHHFPITSDIYFPLHLKWTGDLDLLDEVASRLKEADIFIKNRAVSRQPGTRHCHVTLVLRMRKVVEGEKLFQELLADERFDEVGYS